MGSFCDQFVRIGQKTYGNLHAPPPGLLLEAVGSFGVEAPRHDSASSESLPMVEFVDRPDREEHTDEGRRLRWECSVG